MIQTVKCSLLVDMKFNQGFSDALCTLNLFFCKRNFFFFSSTIPSILLSSEASQLVSKINFSGSIGDKSMIKTVKCSLLVDIKFNQGFYDVLCTLNLFFCKRKFFL